MYEFILLAWNGLTWSLIGNKPLNRTQRWFLVYSARWQHVCCKRVIQYLLFVTSMCVGRDKACYSDGDSTCKRDTDPPFRFESVPRIARSSRLSASSLIILAPLNPFSASIWQSPTFFDM